MDSAILKERHFELKRDLLLRLLVHLDRVAAFKLMFRKAYELTLALVVLVLRRQPGVEYIYLRRGFAKGEVVHFLSDIDITVIIRDEIERQRVEGVVGKLTRLLPVLERESRVYTKDEFLGFFNQEKFDVNRWRSYRIYESSFTWKLLYADKRDNIVKSLPLPRKKMIQFLIVQEALYWHDIVISEYTAYRLGGQKELNYFRTKRICWMFMKATTELTNFCNTVSKPEELRFYRRDIIRHSIQDSKYQLWRALFESNEAILNDQFNTRRYQAYLEQAFSYLGWLYRAWHEQLTRLLENEFTAPVSHLGNDVHDKVVCAYRGMTLDRKWGREFLDEKVAAACLTPQLWKGSKYKVVIIVLLKTLGGVAGEKIVAALQATLHELELRGISRAGVGIQLVDEYGFLCFSTRFQYGLEPVVLVGESELYGPSLYEKVLASISASEDLEAA